MDDFFTICDDNLSITTFLYLQIFAIFNDLNTAMQGRNISLFAAADKTDVIQRKPKAWKFHVSRNGYDML